MGNKLPKDPFMHVVILFIAAVITSLVLHYFVFMPLVFPKMVGLPSE